MIGAGGEHFLRLIAQGDREKGLRMLANTALESELDEDWVSVDLPMIGKMNFRMLMIPIY